MRCSGLSSGWAATPRYKIRLFVFTDSLRAGDSPVAPHAERSKRAEKR